MSRRRRNSTYRLLRALWRYRGRIQAHGDRYQAEVATVVHSALVSNVATRTALSGYRLAMRVLLGAAIALAIIAVVAAVALWMSAGPPWALLAFIPAIPAGVLGFWRLAWGAPLDWLREHADVTQEVPLSELPRRLREIAVELRDLADVPGALSQELDALAVDVERA